MAMQQKLAAILALEAASRPEPTAGAARELGAIQCELVDPTISRFGGRIFALTPSRTLVEFAEAATAVRCASRSSAAWRSATASCRRSGGSSSGSGSTWVRSRA